MLPPAAAVRKEPFGYVTDADIADIAKVDKTAMARFYESTKTAVYGFILSIVRSPADAEDALQETYIKVFTNAGDYVPKGKPMAWVLTIARNQALLCLRNAKHTAGLTDEELEAFFPDGKTFDIEEKQVLSAAMSVLSEEERQIVMLHAVSGFRHREIAEMLAKPLATVLSKYNRAVQKLNKSLKEVL